MPAPKKLLDCALQYLALGLLPAPMDPRDSGPFRPLVRIGKERPSEADVISWFVNPVPGLGVLLGKVSGILVLELTDGPFGDKEIDGIKGPSINLIGDFEQRFYRYPSNLSRVSMFSELRPGVKLLADDAFIPLPPTVWPWEIKEELPWYGLSDEDTDPRVFPELPEDFWALTDAAWATRT